jgi:hypothetical protein
MNLRLGLRLYALFSSTLFVVFMATSSPAVAAGGVGARCGGFAGLPCAKGLWCQMPTNTCNIADGFGRCARKPQFCTRIFKPVCGCNGRTYSNDCVRQTAMVNKRHNGACRRSYR